MITDTSELTIPREILEIEGFMSPEELECLAYIASNTSKARCVLEIGTFRGRSTLALAYGALAGHSNAVYTIDPHEEFTGPLGAKYGPLDRVAFFENLAKFPGLAQVVRPICLTSDEAAAAWEIHGRGIDLLLIDGNHDDAGVDLAMWERFLVPGAAVIFDDREYPPVADAICKAAYLDGYQDKGAVGKLHVFKFGTT